MAVSSTVIIACAAAGAVVVLGVTIKVALVIHRRRTNPPAPLPPARPLTMLQETPWALSRQQHMNTSTHSLPTSISGRGAAMVERGESRHMYKQYGASSTEEALLRQPPSPITPSSGGNPKEQLIPPQPKFFQDNASTHSGERSSKHLSWNSTTDESDLGTYPPQRHQSTTAFPRIPSDPSVTEESASMNGSNPPSPMTSSRRAKRLSATTSASSIRTAASASGSRSNPAPSARSTRSLAAVRGAPHRPHSRVDIVLPAPLSAQMPMPERPRSQYEKGENGLVSTSSRMSVCDPWLSVGRNGMTPSPVSTGAKVDGQRRRTNSEHQLSSRSRSSLSSTSSRTASTDAPFSSSTSSSRASSFTAPSIHSQQSPSRQRKPSIDISQLPPVPRVPSMYSNPASRSGSAAASPVNASAPNQLSYRSDDVHDERLYAAGEVYGGPVAL